jgi:hypothetical protein
MEMFRKAITLGLIGVTAGVISLTAVAKPPWKDGQGEDCRGKMYYKFNAIKVFNKTSANCDNNGNRLFYSQSQQSTINWYPEDSTFNTNGDNLDVNGFEIIDCDGTVDGATAILYDDSGRIPEGTEVMITAALHGPSTLTNFVCERKYEDLSTADCVIGTGTISRKFHTKVNNNLWEDDLYGITWDWEGDWKVMDIRVYEEACSQ